MMSHSNLLQFGTNSLGSLEPNPYMVAPPLGMGARSLGIWIPRENRSEQSVTRIVRGGSALKSRARILSTLFSCHFYWCRRAVAPMFPP
jgi:hypothetical protein